MIPTDALAYVKQELAGLNAGDFARRIRALALRFQKSEATIYRWAMRAGIRRRPEKATKGASKLDPSITATGALLVHVSRRLSNKITLPACDAKEILEDSGLLPAPVSTSTFRRKLRDLKVSPSDLCAPSPHKNMRNEHPNHVWQFDVTNCIQYFLDDKGLGERDMELAMEKNKIVKAAKSIRKQLLRYAAVDHCSGAFYFRYFYASGERPEDGERFLYEAMRPKAELGAPAGKYLFHGVPLTVYADRGSIARAKKLQNLFEALKIDLRTHLPGNPRAKGAIEGLMHILLRFEGRLMLRRPASLEELNAWALDWTIKTNDASPFRHIAPRSALWSTITSRQLRLCPDEPTYLRLVSSGPIEKKVDGSLMIRHNGLRYRVEDVELANTKVTIRENAYESPAIDVAGNGRVWLVRPVEMDAYGRPADATTFGDYKAHPETRTQVMKKEMEKAAAVLGITFKGTAEHRRAEAPLLGFESPLKVFGHQADKVPENVQYLTRPGTPLDIGEPAAPETTVQMFSSFEVPRSIAARRISVTDFLAKLASRMGPVPRALNRRIKDAFPDGVEISEADDIIEQIQSGKWQAREVRERDMGRA
jgi:hypothetical protein